MIDPFQMRAERPEPADGLSIVRRVLEYQVSAAAPDVILAKIVELTNAGRTARDFHPWITTHGPFDRRLSELLFTTVALATYSAYQREQSGVLDEFMPFWELSCMTRFCVDHAALDGLVRPIDDPIWNDLYPPNGWVCGCSVLSCSDWEYDHAPKIQVSQALRERCRNWIDTDPRPIAAML